MLYEVITDFSIWVMARLSALRRSSESFGVYLGSTAMGVLDIGDIEALRQVEVNLNGRPLPASALSVLELDVRNNFV